MHLITPFIEGKPVGELKSIQIHCRPLYMLDETSEGSVLALLHRAQGLI